MGPRCALLLLATTALLSGGCHALNIKSKSNYETLSVDPRHDTKQARAKSERGVEFMEKGHLDKAEKVLQEALVADVTYAPAHNNLGSLYLQRKEYYLAAWEFEYAIKLMRDRAEPYNNLGMVYEAVGRYEDAVQNYELACRNEPRSAEYLGNLARAQIRRGDEPDVVRPLLEYLIFLDTRPDWVGWAREYLALHNPKDQPAQADQPAEINKSTTPEILPTPSSKSPLPEPLPPPRTQARNLPQDPWSSGKQRLSDALNASKVARERTADKRSNSEINISPAIPPLPPKVREASPDD